jgi:hypothetical protein
VMYGTYTTIKQQLTSDDIAGIQSIYGTRQYDQFNTGGHRNNGSYQATNINSYISNNQISIPSLDNTTIGDSEWYSVTVPSTTTGTMNVTVQSSNLSSFAPQIQLYTSSLSLVGRTSAPNTFGATLSYSTSVTAGQSYFIKVLAAGNAGSIGGYGLLVNFGSQTQSPIPPPNTVVPSAPDQGGGMGLMSQGSQSQIGNLFGWIDGLTGINVGQQGGPWSGSNTSTQINVGQQGGPWSGSNTSTQIVSANLASVDGIVSIGVVPGAADDTPNSLIVSMSAVSTPTPSIAVAVPVITGSPVVQALDEALSNWDS